MEVSVSLVTYKTAPTEIQRLSRCLQDSSLKAVWTIVDNSPTKDLKPVAEASGANYIFAGRNLGFGRGHNMAFQNRASSSPYHLVINPDVDFGSGVLKSLVERMESEPSIGLVMPKILYPSGEVQRVFKLLPRPKDLLLRRFSPSRRLVEQNNYSYEMRFKNPEESFEAPSLSGCFMFLRSHVFEKVGGFDERFFMYLEDVDLSRRIGAVAKTLYYPKVSIRHEHGQGSYKSLRLLWHHTCSAIRYFNKWGWWYDSERETVNAKASAKEAA